MVARCRGIFRQRRVGHAGTLDPDATGVLLVGLGRATRLLRFLTGVDKSYVGEVVLGVETTTLDSGGEVVAVYDMSDLTPEAVTTAACRFVGEIDQLPPMVSAVKVGGRRLYELARSGQDVERQPRRVTVSRFDLEPTDDPLVYRLQVDCSSGTYIRSLAADLGTALGGGGHLRNLRRTRVGLFTVDEALPIEQLSPESVLSPAEALRGWPRIAVDAATATAVGHGSLLDLEVEPGTGTADQVAVLGADGALLAVYEHRPDGRWKPALVMAAS